MIISIGYFLISVSLIFLLISLSGIYRFPDIYTKIHSSSIADSFAIPLCLFGLSLISPNIILSIKLIILALLFFIITPVSSNAIIKSAWFADEKSKERDM